jgi:iron complex outermembrane receptor protein
LYPYEPEYSNNWEIGSKNSFNNNTFRLNAAAFYTLVNDVQVPTLVLPDAITIIRNAGKLRSFGAEIEASASFNNFQFDVSLGATDAEYTSLKVSQGGNEVDLSGKKQIFTPAATAMVSAQYSLPLDARKRFHMITRASMVALGKQYFDLSNTIEQSGYALVNLRLGFATKNFEIFYWGMNVGDRKYISYAYDFGAVHLGDPATHGVTLAARF